MTGVDIAFTVRAEPISGLFDVEKDAVFHLILNARLAYCTAT